MDMLKTLPYGSLCGYGVSVQLKMKMGVVSGVISSTQSESEESERFHFFRFRLRLRRL